MKDRKSALESCMDIMDSFNGNDRIITSRIFYRSNLNFDKIKIYLDFLKSKGLVDSSTPNKRGAGQQGEEYFLTEDGCQFRKDWEKYKRENEIEKLKELLERI
jgi:predicted transcriptional regulator